MAVVGPGGSQEVLAIGKIMKKAKLPFVSSSATASSLTNGSNPTFFRDVPADTVEAPTFSRVVERDVAARTVTIRAEENEGRAVITDTGVEIGRWVKERLTITEGDPLSGETEMGSVFSYAKGAWRTRVSGRCRLRATKTEWLLSADLDAWEGDEQIFGRHLDVPIVRDLM